MLTKRSKGKNLICLTLGGVTALSASAYEVIEDFESPESASWIMAVTTKRDGLEMEISGRFVTTGTKVLHVKISKPGSGIVGDVSIPSMGYVLVGPDGVRKRFAFDCERGLYPEDASQ